MRSFLKIILGVALLVSSAQLYAQTPDVCNVALYESAGSSIKTGDVSYNGAKKMLVGGSLALDGMVQNELDMFEKVMALYNMQLNGSSNESITGMNPGPVIKDAKGNNTDPLKIIPVQTSPTGDKVMIGNNGWHKDSRLVQSGSDLPTLFYDILAASYAKKLNILAVDPNTFTNRTNIIDAVKASADKIKACEDAKTAARKDLAKLVGVSEVEKPNYSDADQITLQGAIDVADDVHDNPLATLTELKGAKIKLETEKGKLTPTKKSENTDRGKVLALNNLKDLIDQVEDNKDMFPAYLLEKINPELNDAKAVRDNANATTPEIEKAHDDLLDAYTNAHADLLKDLIGLVEGGLGGYSDEAKAILEPAIEDAKVVRDDADASADEISAAIIDLLSAKVDADLKDGKISDADKTVAELLEEELAKLIKELEKKNPTTNPTIDNNTRLALVDLIEGLLADYSDAAKGDLEKAIKDARAIINNPDSSNADLEKALMDLIKAKLLADMKDNKIPTAEITDAMIKAELDRLLKSIGRPGKQKSYTLDEVRDATSMDTKKTVNKEKSYTLDQVRDATDQDK